MNQICFILILSLVNISFETQIHKLTESQLQHLANIDPKQLPKSLHTKWGDNSHWCCANEQPVASIQRTRIGSQTVNEAFTIITGYQDCGNWLVQHKCPIEAVVYRIVSQYFVEHYETPDYSLCPDNHVKCCANYINVAGNCYDPFHISDHFDILLQLGLVSTVKPNLIGK